MLALIIGDTLYLANTGDSRALLSVDSGREVIQLTNDHKPTDPIEQNRILMNGGQIYQNTQISMRPSEQVNVMLGPHRVFPGRLSVSRTIGDIEAKAEHLTGNPKIVISDPDITVVKLEKKHDFLVLACDGIFDKLDDKEAVHFVW